MALLQALLWGVGSVRFCLRPRGPCPPPRKPAGVFRLCCAAVGERILGPGLERLRSLQLPPGRGGRSQGAELGYCKPWVRLPQGRGPSC